jgi:hypothetical protein
MPGGQGFEQVGDYQYSGVLQIKVGPVQGTFQGQVKLLDIHAPDSYQMEVEGQGAPGFIKASGGLRLETRNGQTYMAYSGKAQIGGRIASVGQRLLDSSARSIIRQSLEALNEYLKVKTAQQAQAAQPTATPGAAAENAASVPTSAPTAVPEYKPPSQTKLALNVAKDVFNDLVPAQYQPLLIGAVLIILAIIIWLLLR